ncbi:zinc-dependent alcohol dehydrogenase family protein [Aliikangiella coralliicola]|uniref:Zinc-dependent alcohol dehydrogenase family protein n=1 Tax=Aliikangiella coralliicola TaxID=2592383 RepID=A0A545UCU4_9GAMM|nr:zinc-dependent alcohol dehydrogenase family protein [Aliikangiella coralliicola]TQV87286.1 zinc-dependent alcohol dehydrogenase family protein [Aliikangiella coralliicola]
MKAIVYENFKQLPSLQTVADPTPSPHGAVVKVAASGVCRSDWHGWMGHDSDIQLPHVPGHELAGTIEAIGKNVSQWKIGDRVTVPFIAGCGKCGECTSGNQQVCANQTQPGFTHWGSFAEYVAIDYVDSNLVALPHSIDFVTAASLGCRFATSFRAVVAQGKVRGGHWVAVHGCGGVGISAVMIASALGASVIAIDINEDKLKFAQSLGAIASINASNHIDVIEAIKSISGGGVDVSLDALGSRETSFNSVASLRAQGKHIQVGLMVGENRHSPLPMDLILAKELEVIGSHGMQAHAYPAMMQMIAQRKLAPQKLVSEKINLQRAIHALTNMDKFESLGVTVINEF